MLGCSTLRINALHFAYGCRSLSGGYLCELYVESQSIALDLCVSNFYCSLCWLPLPLQSLGYTTLMGAPRYVRPMVFTFTLRITVLHYAYGCATLKVAYICKIYLENHRVTLHLWVPNLMSSQFSLALPKESLCYTSLMGAPP